MNSERAARMESGCVASPARPQAYPRTGIASFKFITLEENFFNLSFLFLLQLVLLSSFKLFLSLLLPTTTTCRERDGDGRVMLHASKKIWKGRWMVLWAWSWDTWLILDGCLGVVDTSQLGVMGLNGT